MGINSEWIMLPVLIDRYNSGNLDKDTFDYFMAETGCSQIDNGQIPWHTVRHLMVSNHSFSSESYEHIQEAFVNLEKGYLLLRFIETKDISEILCHCVIALE